MSKERPVLRKNDQHSAMILLSSIGSPPKEQRKRLEESWAGTLYQEYIRSDGEPFPILYWAEPSRLNISLNVLVVLGTLNWYSHPWMGWEYQPVGDADRSVMRCKETQ